MTTKVVLFLALSSFVAAVDVQSSKSSGLTAYQEAKSDQATTNLVTIGLCSFDDPNSSECKSEKAITLFTFLFLLLGAFVKCLTSDEGYLDEY